MDVFGFLRKKWKSWIFGVLAVLFCASCGSPADEPLPVVLQEFGSRDGGSIEGSDVSDVPETELAAGQTEVDPVPPVETEWVDSEEKSGPKYAYSHISPEAQTVYDEILECMLSHEDSVTVSTTDPEVLDLAYHAVRADHGELFWVEQYVYTTYSNQGEVKKLEFAPDYTMDREQRMAMQRSIDASAEQMLTGITSSASDYEKAKHVFETLVRNVSYDLDAPENQNIISAFIYRKTVCQGYACAAQYLLRELGVESTVVTGYSDNEPHAWNLVELDDSYYYMDTWGNAGFGEDPSLGEDYINYEYLNVTTEELERTHRPEVDFELPVCTATEDNYFVKEGLYFSEWNRDAVGELLSRSWQSDRLPVSVKFGDRDLANKAFSYFITEKHIGDYCPGMTGFQYLDDLTQNVMTVCF